MTLFEFLCPYLRFFQGAAYNLHQTLDGLGISSAGFSGPPTPAPNRYIQGK